MPNGDARAQIDAPSIRMPGLILGIGLGGFCDGIFLHQVLQWHHLFTSVYPDDTLTGLRMNTLGDGLFHTVTWLAVLFGLWLLYSRVTRDRRAVWGSGALWSWILAGWGLFNLVEGLVDHQILGIHHVRPGPHQFAWDMAFLASGVLLGTAGWFFARNAAPIVHDRSGR